LRITGDGVRLRTQPVTGTVLGLMYRGDVIKPWTSSSAGWHYGYSPRVHHYGWVWSGYTQNICG
jgi:hypothetical protein